jgi:hypothetical protein
MRPKLKKKSVLKFAGQIIPRISGEQSRISGGSETPISEAQCIEIGWSNYPA